jgi:hypothetical protein
MPASRQADMMVAVAALTPKFHGRFKFWQMTSVDACKDMPAWIRPEFVYIDGAHDYNSARMDIDCWWNRLEPNGILAGHDYDPTHPGVVEAVNEFSDAHNVIVRLTAGDQIPSWYAYKQEPSSLFDV